MIETIVYSETTLVDGRLSVVYLTRNNSDVRMTDLLLSAGINTVSYGINNSEDIYNAGYTPPYSVSPIALFEATKNRQVSNVHLGAIYSAFQQLQIGGTLADMKIAAKQVYSQNDEQLIRLNAFIAEFKNASENDRNELLAIAIYASSTLVTL